MPRNPCLGEKTYISVKLSGIATYFSTCRLTLTVTDKMANETFTAAIPLHDNGTSLIPVDTSHCGAYTYKVTKLAVYDLLGFFHLNIRPQKGGELLVKPVPVIPDIMPDSFGFKAKNLRKAKQPYSEIYDIREYAPGDPIKSIHWKISAKKDRFYVKEPLEEYGGHSRVLLKLTTDRTEFDTHLGQVLFTSRFFLEREVSHRIRIIPPDSSEISFNIESDTDLEKAIAGVLRMRLPKEEEHAD